MPEGLNDHPDEVQVWAVRSRVPDGQSVEAWLAWAVGLGIRGAELLDTGGRYSHLALRHGAALWEAGPRGVRDGLAAAYLRRCFEVDVYHVVVREADEASIIRWLCGHVGEAYDYAQIARMLLRRIGFEHWVARIIALLDSESVGVCSTLVALAYRLVELDLPHLVGVPLWDFAPDHLWHAHRIHPERVLSRGRLEVPNG